MLIIITGLWNSIYRVTRLRSIRKRSSKVKLRNSLYPTKLEKKKDKASITINLDYRRNCYNTRLLGYSQIIVTPATTDTATTTTTILARIAQTQTNTDKEKDDGSVRISTDNICFHMPHCWLSCA
jgi:hypothetical protein